MSTTTVNSSQVKAVKIAASEETNAVQQIDGVEPHLDQAPQEEQKASQYEVHELALQFPAQTPEESGQLKENMLQRVHQGLPPLESPILLVGGKIADGRHRHKIWRELAEEGAADGYFGKNPPPVEVCSEQDDEAAALLRINSRNLCHRTLPAGQKAAIFVQQLEKFPSLKLLVEKIRSENADRMKAGKPLDNKSQGSTTNEKLAQMAGVSPSTIKAVNTAKAKSPHNLEKIAKGELSIKAALKDAAQSEEADKPKQKSKPAKPENDTQTKAKPLSKAEPGDKVFTLQHYEYGNGDIALLEHILLKVESGSCHFEDGGTMDASAIYDKANATLRRQAKLKTELESLLMEVNSLRKAAKNPPAIQSAQKRRKNSQ